MIIMGESSNDKVRRIKLVKSMVTVVFCIVASYALMSKARNGDRNYLQLEQDRGKSWEEKSFIGKEQSIVGGTSRHLQSARYDVGDVDHDDDQNCTMRGIEKFPNGVFTLEQRQHGALVVNFLASLYLCGVIGYVCSAYFVPSLEILCERLNLQPDVAGATFMAAGSSAPELFSTVIGTFITFDDTGMSAIVGSAAFNIFVIIALCCFFAGQELTLNWWPFVRDCVIYVISILLMVAFIYDSKVYWWEGLILSCGYIVYITIMYFNTYLSEQADALSARWRARKERRAASKESSAYPSDSVGLLSENPNNISYGTTYGDAQTPNGVLSKGQSHRSNGIASDAFIENGPSWKDETQYTERPRTVTATSSVVDHPPLSEHDSHVFTPPSSWFFRTLWVLGLPAVLLTFLTIPDCRKQGIWRRLYFITFVFSTIWLGAAAYILYWMIVVIGYTLDIPDTVMGISFLAGGTSVPDAIASVLVARDGYGDMALSNIIGSNIFEVFICLGLLWFIYGLIHQEPVEIASEGLVFTTIALLLTVAFILLAIHLNRWKLDFKMGVICLSVYAIFITFAILWELGVVGDIEVPNYCPIAA